MQRHIIREVILFGFREGIQRHIAERNVNLLQHEIRSDHKENEHLRTYFSA